MGPIAIFLPSLQGGGAEKVMVKLANEFSRIGYSVHLVLVSAEGPCLLDVDENVRVFDLQCQRTLFSVFSLMRYIIRNKPSSMLSALTHTNIVAIIARFLAYKHKFRLVVSERSTFGALMLTKSSRSLRIVLRVIRFFYAYCDKVVVVSNGAAAALNRIGKVPFKDISVIYNPIYDDELMQKAAEPVEHPWVNDKKVPLLLAVGRLTQAKDFFTLIKAVGLVNEVKEVRLIILGEGNLRCELEKTVEELGLVDKISLFGYVNNPIAWMAKSDVFVLSSAWEGLPGALIQAMACGTRVVSTDCESGPREILEDGRWGELVNVGDSTALAAAILNTLKCPPIHDINLRAKCFSVEISAIKYLELLNCECA